MLCPACGYENLPGVDFCQECLSNLSHLDISQSTMTESRIEKAILKEKVYQIYFMFDCCQRVFFN